MSVNSSMGDGNIQAYNDDALAQQVVFQTSALPAEVAAGGVRVNMIPEGRRQHLQGRRVLRRHGARAGRPTTSTTSCAPRASSTATSSQHVQDFNFNMGGPIMKDRLWFFSTVAPRVGGRRRRQLVLSGRLLRQPGHRPQGRRSVDPAPVRARRADPPDLPGEPEDEGQLVSRAHLEAQGSGTAVRLQPDHRIRHPRSACTRSTTSARSKITSTLTNRLLLEAGYSTNLERLSQQYQPAIEAIAAQPFTAAWYQQRHAHRPRTATSGAPRLADRPAPIRIARCSRQRCPTSPARTR